MGFLGVDWDGSEGKEARDREHARKQQEIENAHKQQMMQIARQEKKDKLNSVTSSIQYARD